MECDNDLLYQQHLHQHLLLLMTLLLVHYCHAMMPHVEEFCLTGMYAVDN